MTFYLITKMQAVYVEWTFVACTAVLVFLRLYYNWTRKGRLFWQDGFIILAWFFFAFQTAADWTMTHFYATQPALTEDDHTTLGNIVSGRTEYLTLLIAKLKYAENVTYYGCLYMVKFAWLCFFHTLIPKALPHLRIAYWVVTAISVTGYVFTTLINTLYCIPVSTRWAIGNGTYCSNAQWVWITIATLHSATDIIIYVLPILLVRHLQNLTKRNRLGVALLFALGFICVGWAITLQVQNLTNVPGSVVCISGAFEQSWAILVVCLPSFKALLLSGFREAKFWKRSKDVCEPHGSSADGSMENVSQKESGGNAVVKQRSIESGDMNA